MSTTVDPERTQQVRAASEAALPAAALPAAALPAAALPAAALPAAALPAAALPAAALPAAERRFMAIVLPDLLNELALSREPAPPRELTARELTARELTARGPRAARSHHSIPRAVVLTSGHDTALEPTHRLDSVNTAARRSGVLPRQTIAQATALVECLSLHAVPMECVVQALKRVAEAALGFGSPVSFCVPDTVWVEVSGVSHLFGGERELAVALVAHVRSLGHALRLASASGPWLAQSFARHFDFDETGICLIPASQARQAAARLPIGALPIESDTVAWFSRLGLLELSDLGRLPRAALAARLEARTVQRVLDLIEGRDDGVLDAHVPERLPLEEQSWDTPLESVEPLLFVLRGLAARLGARLEGRGQAARELLLTIQYDRAIANLQSRERESQQQQLRDPRQRQAGGGRAPSVHLARARASAQSEIPGVSPGSSEPTLVKEIRFELASPLAHGEDIERIVRSRLQRETLRAPATGLRLQVSAITEARQWQLSLEAVSDLKATLASDPHTLALLVAELSADVGEDAVGVLEAHDSHLLEKSSSLVSIHSILTAAARLPRGRREIEPPRAGESGAAEEPAPAPHEVLKAAQSPTRLITPIEFKAPLEEEEIVVIERRAFSIQTIKFEQRLEAVEWWASSPVSRDYFRVWLAALTESHFSDRATDRAAEQPSGGPQHSRRDGLEVLVYVNRDDGKKFVQALYD
jgi:protein ImuB